MNNARNVAPDIDILPSYFPIPGFGTLPVNAYVLKARQPVLVDTGLHMDTDAFVNELESTIDPSELRWLYLTHPDQDHVGSLVRLLDRVPQMRLITTFLGYGILSLFTQIGLDRVYFLNPGESLDIGDRTLTALKPPTFDNPATTGFIDNKTRALFSSDSFGALLQSEYEDARDISRDDLIQGQVAWTTVDSPWLHKIDESKFAAELNTIRQMEPSIILSAHLPPAQSLTDRMLQTLSTVPGAAPFAGPNQVMLEAMLAQMTGAPAGATA